MRRYINAKLTLIKHEYIMQRNALTCLLYQRRPQARMSISEMFPNKKKGLETMTSRYNLLWNIVWKTVSYDKHICHLTFYRSHVEVCTQDVWKVSILSDLVFDRCICPVLNNPSGWCPYYLRQLWKTETGNWTNNIIAPFAFILDRAVQPVNS